MPSPSASLKFVLSVLKLLGILKPNFEEADGLGIGFSLKIEMPKLISACNLSSSARQISAQTDQ
jgi:hypothetical protein